MSLVEGFGVGFRWVRGVGFPVEEREGVERVEGAVGQVNAHAFVKTTL